MLLKEAKLIFVAVFFGLLISLVIGVSTSYPHDWYDGSCCNENDCRQTELGEVERHDDGWYVVPTKELIPFDDIRIKKSLDPLIHRCLMTSDQPHAYIDGKDLGPKKKGDTRCLYVPEISG